MLSKNSDIPLNVRGLAPPGAIVAVLGDEEASAGQFLRGVVGTKIADSHRAPTGVAWVGATDGLFRELCIFENLYLGIGSHSRLAVRSRGTKKYVDELLRKSGSRLSWSDSCEWLRASEEALVGTLRCLLQDARVYTLDGLVSRLSQSASRVVGGLISQRSEGGATTWFSLQDLRFDLETTTHVCCLRNGRAVYFGARNAVHPALLQSFTSSSDAEVEAVVREELLRSVGTDPTADALFQAIGQLGRQCLGWIGAHFVCQGSVVGSFGTVRPGAELVAALEQTIANADSEPPNGSADGGWDFHLPAPSPSGTRFGFLAYTTRDNVCAVDVDVFWRGVRAAFDEAWHSIEADRKAKRDLTLHAISTLAGGVVHEFNNSLFVVNTSVETLAALNQDEALLAPLDAIRQTTRHSAQLTEKMLSLTDGGSEPHRPLDLHEVVEEARVFLEASAMKYGMGLRVSCEADHAWIAGGRAELHGMVVNLIKNGIEASRGRAHATLTLTTSNELPEVDQRMHRVVCPGLTQPSSFVRLSVIDEGRGMTTALLERAFEPLETTNATAGGSGLGLSIVYRSMLEHKGFVETHSADGVGTEVHLYFPRVEPAESNERRSTASALPSIDRIQGGNAESRTVLVCDDEQRVRSSVERILELSGYEVEVVEDGAACVAKFAESPSRFGALLIDDLMPGMSGHECLDHIRAVDQTVPVFVVSGYYKPERFAAHVDSPWTRFHPKPVEWAVLLEELGDLVVKRQQR